MIIGLTGGIGSGKTWVTSLFSDLGIPVYISDKEAKNLMHTNAKIKQEIKELFGDKAYLNEKLNRDFISQKVFDDKSLLNQLNAIVHPVVADDFEHWYNKQTKPFVIKESAILFEIGGNTKCDKVILITAPIKERISRVQIRDTVSVETIKKRINNQWSDEKKIPLADFVITNTMLEKTKQNVNELHNILLDLC